MELVEELQKCIEFHTATLKKKAAEGERKEALAVIGAIRKLEADLPQIRAQAQSVLDRIKEEQE